MAEMTDEERQVFAEYGNVVFANRLRGRGFTDEQIAAILYEWSHCCPTCLDNDEDRCWGCYDSVYERD